MSKSDIKPIKIFILADGYSQFEGIVSKYKEELLGHEVEQLVEPYQINSLTRKDFEVWDVRTLAVEVAKRGVEPFVME